MILKEDSTEQKLRGAYYTPLKLAEKMVDFFKQDASIKSILEAAIMKLATNWQQKISKPK